jgi:hypothetical protein
VRPPLTAALRQPEGALNVAGRRETYTFTHVGNCNGHRRRNRLPAWQLASALACCALTACSPTPAQNGAGLDAATVPKCIPGQSAACACVTGVVGAQTCQSDGAYTPCACSGGEGGVATMTRTCSTGQNMACACAAGGSGAETCGSNGVYGNCVCGSIQADAGVDGAQVGGVGDSSVDQRSPSADATVSTVGDGSSADVSSFGRAEDAAEEPAADAESSGNDAESPIPACAACPADQITCIFMSAGFHTGPACLTPDQVNTPTFGCNATSCASPCVLPNAHPTCSNGACAIASCNVGWADCNGDPTDGCEADLLLPQTCGGCTACSGNEVCTPSGCAAACPANLVNCSGACRDAMTDPQACGNCTTDCGPTGTCSGGNCGADACDPDGYDPNACGGNCQGCDDVSGASNYPVGAVCNAGLCELVYAAGWPANPESSTAVVPYLNNPQGIVVDDTNAYYSEVGVWQVPKGGGTPLQLATDSPTFIAIDDSFVYWMGATSIQRVAKGGGTVSPVVTPPETPSGGLAVDDANVYWVGGGSFYSAPKGGGGVATILAGGVEDPDAGPMAIAYTAAPSGPVLAAGTLGYSQDGSLWTLSTSGGAVTELAVVRRMTGYTAYGPVAASSTSIAYVYAIEPQGFYSIAGNMLGNPGSTVSGSGPIPQGPFVLDSCAIFYSYNNGIAKVLINENMVGEPLVSTPNAANQMAIDDMFIYWTDRDSVRRASK